MIKSKASTSSLQCNFGKVLGKTLQAGFFGDHVTDAGGAQLISQVEEKNGMIAGFAECIPEWRYEPEFSIKHLVAQRTVLIAAGYEDAIDSTLKRGDLALGLSLAAISGNPDVACQATICIFENRITEAVCNALAQWFLKCYVERRNGRDTKQIVLDLDGSSVRAYGNQEKTGYHGYYKTNMYFPLFVYDQDGWLIACTLRPGTESEDAIIVSELKRIVPKLKAAWPKVTIIVRADAGVYHPAICDWCEDNDVFYLMRFQASGHGGGSLQTSSDAAAESAQKAFRKRYKRERYMYSRISKTKLQTEIKKLSNRKKRKEKLKELEDRAVRLYTQFMHRTGKSVNDKKAWRCERLIICALTHTDWGGERTFFVTNITNLGPECLLKLYNQRGEAELFIREMKAIKCSRLSCQSFFANQFRLFLHGLTYLLLLQLKRALPRRLRHLSIASIQKYFIRIPARVTQASRVFVLRWSDSFRWKKSMIALCRTLDRQKPLRI